MIRTLLLIKEYQHLKICKKRITAIKIELQRQSDIMSVLSERVEKEYSDIQKLEDQPLNSLFNLVLKNRQEQLEKENQEYLMAILNFNEGQKITELLEYELEILQGKTLTEKDLLKEITESINELDPKVHHSNKGLLNDFQEINQELQDLMHLRIESEEALVVTLDVRTCFLDIIDNLNKAQQQDNWGKFYSEIQEAKRMQKTYIDAAQGHVYILKKLLLFLNAELEDVQDYLIKFKRSEIIIRRFDVSYYQNLLSDWVNDAKLSHTLSTSMMGSATISKLATSLKNLIHNTATEQKLLEIKREKILDSIDI